MKRGRFTRAVATVSGLTGISRILGFVRDQMLAGFIGPGVTFDAWQAAFALPNAFRRLFAEGAMSAAFVPMLRERLSGQKSDEKHGKAFARSAFSFLLLILAPLISLMIVFMPSIMDTITGFGPESRALELSIFFGRIMLPYLMLMSLMALVGGVLDALGQFAAKAFAPTMLNIILILALVLIGWKDLAPGSWLSWATLVAGFAQLAVVWVPAARMGWAPGLSWPHDMIPFLRRMVPGLIANGGSQISFLVVLSLASSVEQDLSHRYFADRLYQLPLGLIGIALNTVLLSSLSNLIARRQDQAAIGQLNRGLELSFLLAIPIAAACLFSGDFLFQGLFQFGRFTANDTQASALALMGFAFGIPAAVGQKVLQPAYFARKNTRVPMLHSLGSIAVAIGFSYALFGSLGLFGLCLASSIAAWTGFLSLGVHLVIDRYFRPDRQLFIRLLPIMAASAIMVLGLERILGAFSGFETLVYELRLPATLLLITASAALYFGLAYILGAFNKSDLQKLRDRD